MRSDNLRAAPSWITPDMVARILALAMPVDGQAAPVTTIPTRGVKPRMEVIARARQSDTPNDTSDTLLLGERVAPSDTNDTVSPVTHSRRAEEGEAAKALGIPPTASPPRRKKTMADKAAEFEAARIDGESAEQSRRGRVEGSEKALASWVDRRKAEVLERILANRPLFQIAADRGIAVVDLAHALGQPVPTLLVDLRKAGFYLGKRPPLADPLTRQKLLELANPNVPLPELRSARLKEERLQREAAAKRDRRVQESSREVEHRTVRQAERRAAPREPAPSRLPEARAHPLPERAKIDIANKARSAAVRRAHTARAEAALDAGKTATRDIGLKIAMRQVQNQRAEQHRLGCPIEQAKRVLQRRYAPVCSMAVHGGDPNLFQVGHRKDVSREELLAMAEKLAA